MISFYLIIYIYTLKEIQVYFLILIDVMIKSYPNNICFLDFFLNKNLKKMSNNNWRFMFLDKVIFITGGAGWVAQHIAKTCYEHGARIVLADLNLEKISQMINEIFGTENIDDRILPVQLDVQNEETIKKAIELTVNKWNTIHILINTLV